jgi:hypothetical protein
MIGNKKRGSAWGGTKAVVWGLSILTLVFGFALAGCGGDDDSGGEDNEPSSASVFIATADTAIAGSVVTATAAVSVGATLYAVYDSDGRSQRPAYYGTCQWYRDGQLIEVRQPDYKLYDTSVAGNYTVIFTPENKPALTSAPVTVSDVTTASVSISVDACHASGMNGGYKVSVSLTLSDGAWGTYKPDDEYYPWGFTNEQERDSTRVTAFKNAVTVTDNVTTLTDPTSVGVSDDNNKTVTFFYKHPSIPTSGSETVTATLDPSKLADLVQYTSLASGGTLTAGTITASDSEWIN